MGVKLKPVLTALVSLLILLALVALAKLYYFSRYTLNVPEDGIVYILKPGMSLRHFAHDLAKQDILADVYSFVFVAKLRGDANKIQAGEYFIVPGTTPLSLLNQVTSGDVIQYPIRIGEGWTFAQVRTALAENPHLKHTIGSLSNADIMQRLQSEYKHPEGLFYPDTYLSPSMTTDIAILRRAHNKMLRFLDSAWKTRADSLPYTRPYEGLILASIIEKESAVADERPQIASVLVNRLSKNMRLQADPTVIYGLADAYDGNLTKKQLRQYTPYNTYKIIGLPITPIAMPSSDSIVAAFHPDSTNYLYFVAQGDDGRHYFSATLKEHNKAVHRLIQQQKKKIH